MEANTDAADPERSALRRRVVGFQPRPPPAGGWLSRVVLVLQLQCQCIVLSEGSPSRTQVWVYVDSRIVQAISVRFPIDNFTECHTHQRYHRLSTRCDHTKHLRCHGIGVSLPQVGQGVLAHICWVAAAKKYGGEQRRRMVSIHQADCRTDRGRHGPYTRAE